MNCKVIKINQNHDIINKEEGVIMNINCDGVVYNPLGGASYMFEKEIIPYLLMNLTKK